MAEWEFAGRTYRFTSAEFAEKKRKYQAKYGSTVYVPGFEDIVHYRHFPAMTAEEKRLWKRRNYDEIPKERREQIRHEKARKKERFLAMLASPSPNIANNVGSIMTALDDAQDAVSTLACIGTIGIKMLPVGVKRALSGPIGWAWFASDVMNMINPFSRASAWWRSGASGREPKRIKDRLTKYNPTTVKGKAIIAKRIRKFAPTSANLCEAAQTADQLFGVGLSLGPVVGFLQDLAFAGWKTHLGEFVDLKFTPRARNEWMDAAFRGLFSGPILGCNKSLQPPEEEMFHRIAAYFANMAIYPYVATKSGRINIDMVRDALYHAPEPTDPLTIEIIEEELGPDDKRIGIPGLGGTTAPLAKVDERIQSLAKEKHKKFAEENNHSIEAMIASECSCMVGLNTLALIGGVENVETDYVVQSKIIHKIYNNGWMYPDNISMSQVNTFMNMTDDWESTGYNPSSKEMQSLAQLHCGFKFVPAIHLSGW